MRHSVAGQRSRSSSARPSQAIASRPRSRRPTPTCRNPRADDVAAAAASRARAVRDRLQGRRGRRRGQKVEDRVAQGDAARPEPRGGRTSGSRTASSSRSAWPWTASAASSSPTAPGVRRRAWTSSAACSCTSARARDRRCSGCRSASRWTRQTTSTSGDTGLSRVLVFGPEPRAQGDVRRKRRDEGAERPRARRQPPPSLRRRRAAACPGRLRPATGTLQAHVGSRGEGDGRVQLPDCRGRRAGRPRLRDGHHELPRAGVRRRPALREELRLARRRARAVPAAEGDRGGRRGRGLRRGLGLQQLPDADAGRAAADVGGRDGAAPRPDAAAGRHRRRSPTSGGSSSPSRYNQRVQVFERVGPREPVGRADR